MTTDPGGSAMDETQADDSVHADTRERRVIEPDLLWIKGVTERLLGTAGRPAAWERAYFEDATDETPTAPESPAAGAAPAVTPAVDAVDAGDELAFRPADPRQQLGQVTASELSAPTAGGLASQAVPAAEPLPQREVRDFDGPIRYRQPKAPAVSAPALPVGRPASLSHPSPYAEIDPLTSPEPPPYDGPLAPQAPAEPRHTDDMPPAVLRAALRDALPDDLGLRSHGSPGSPADAVFGDPRWNLPPEDDEPAVLALGPDLALDHDLDDDLAPTAPPTTPTTPPPPAAPISPIPPAAAAPTYPGVTSYLPTPEEIAQPLAPTAGTSPEGSLYAAALAEDLAQEQVPAARTVAPEPAAPAAAPPERVSNVPTRPEPEIVHAPDPAPAEPAAQSVIAPDELLAADAASTAPPVTPAEETPVTEARQIPVSPEVAPAPAASEPPPAQSPAAAPAESGFPRPIEDLEASDVALRRAFLSGDSDLAEAVVRLIGEQGRDKQRIRTVLAYLDALLDGGGQALPGAARLRALLGDA